MAPEVVISCSLLDQELDRHFGDARAHLTPQGRQHLEGCQSCSALWNALLESPGGLKLSSELRRTIEEAIRGSLQPVSPLPSVPVLTGQFLVVFLLVSLFKVATLGVAVFGQMSVIEVIGSTLATLIGAAVLSLSLARQMTPGSLRRFSPRGAVGVLTAGFLVGATLLIPWHQIEVFRVEGWPCFRTGVLIAVPVGLVYWLLVRRGRPLSALALGATLGAIAGLLAATLPTVPQLTCSHQEVVGHLWVWHGGVVMVSTMVGVLIAQMYDRLDFGWT